jgi:hypothetical protein
MFGVIPVTAAIGALVLSKRRKNGAVDEVGPHTSFIM